MMIIRRDLLRDDAIIVKNSYFIKNRSKLYLFFSVIFGINCMTVISEKLLRDIHFRRFTIEEKNIIWQ